MSPERPPGTKRRGGKNNLTKFRRQKKKGRTSTLKMTRKKKGEKNKEKTPRGTKRVATDGKGRGKRQLEVN